jgi:hypothetical protein
MPADKADFEDFDEDNLGVDPLEEGMDPPEHWAEADKYGMTEAEARQRQDWERRLAEEEPDVAPDQPGRPFGATPDDELDESIDDLTDDEAFTLEETARPAQSDAVRRGQSADEAGGSIADEIRTPHDRGETS